MSELSVISRLHQKYNTENLSNLMYSRGLQSAYSAEELEDAWTRFETYFMRTNTYRTVEADEFMRISGVRMANRARRYWDWMLANPPQPLIVGRVPEHSADYYAGIREGWLDGEGNRIQPHVLKTRTYKAQMCHGMCLAYDWYLELRLSEQFERETPFLNGDVHDKIRQQVLADRRFW